VKGLYSSPLRVYLCLGLLSLAGLYAGSRLPVSLFPNSSKPEIGVNVSYGSSTAREFLDTYGAQLEGELKGISTDEVESEKLTADYGDHSVRYNLSFKWGVDARKAQREVENTVHAYSARFPEEVRKSVSIWASRENSGFLAISYFSEKRSLDELYKVLEPVLTPRLAKVRDAAGASLYNPSQKEVRVELIPGKMGMLQLFPRDVERAVALALSSNGGGAITVGTQQLSVQMPPAASALEDLSRVLVPTPGGSLVHLSDVAHIDFGPSSSSQRSFKTNGAPSLILFAEPRAGGNVKNMAEEMIQIAREVQPTLPEDIQYKILVDPSEFIRGSISNVLHEVLIGAFLAVLILYLFIGSLRNTITAAIEIPLSMVLAFILMRLSGMNLNLISLGGLALSAGMNVDASVVVMENIFRHFEATEGELTRAGKLDILVKSVKEVRFAVIASTIASLVVFLPLAFTSELSYAILGDLAKTVVFSHGFSAFVALILVPTVRLHLMSGKRVEAHPRAPIEGLIRRLEEGYASALGTFLRRPALRNMTYLSLAAVLAALAAFVLPRLPREIVGRPDTDWMIVSVNTQGNRVLRQMESQAEETESRLLARFGDKVQYTFTQVSGTDHASVMARLRNKGDMRALWKEIEAFFPNTPALQYWVGPWNPAELPIPDPPQLEVSVQGGSAEDRLFASQQLRDVLEGGDVFPRIWTKPGVKRDRNVLLRPRLELWPQLRARGATFLPGDLADLTRVATEGRSIGQLEVETRLTDIYMRYPEASVAAAEDIGALPIGVGAKLVPLKALAEVTVDTVPPSVHREDGHELFSVYGEMTEDRKPEAGAALERARKLIDGWKSGSRLPVTVTFEDAEKDLHEALRQLAVAVGLSILLIFLTLVIQFGSVANAMLVLVAVPLGFIGVLGSLLVFRSTLSLNSALGVILLNGIAVANSIILVDFLKRLVDQGMAPAQAAVEAGRRRLRPILITSLTTILGMMPIALGVGEGGRILQPLGIAVSGGLWVSMALTLFLVPGLQVSFLEWRSRRARPSAPAGAVATDWTGEDERPGLQTRIGPIKDGEPRSTPLLQ
jgi:HAE1 family hydrophobic/amphiphilic exporter-1